MKNQRKGFISLTRHVMTLLFSDLPKYWQHVAERNAFVPVTNYSLMYANPPGNFYPEGKENVSCVDHQHKHFCEKKEMH